MVVLVSRARFVAAALVVASMAFVAAACGGSGAAKPRVASTAATAVCVGKIAVMAPYGGLTALDSIQMNWARVAIDKYNLDHNTSFTIEPSNVDFRPEDGVREAKRLAADSEVVGVVGPQTSGVTEAVGPIFDAAGLVYVSPSATRTSLTDGSLKNFFRVVANDSKQGPAIANFIVRHLQPSTVLIVDGSETYSTALALDIAHRLTQLHTSSKIVKVQLEQKDYSAAIEKIDSTVNVVALPLLLATDGARFVKQMHAAGKFPEVIGSDMLFVSTFDVPGAYVSTFAPDSSKLAAGAQIIRLYQSIFGAFEPFGGPAYVAMQVVATAADAACRRDGEVTRRGVLSMVPQVRIPRTVIGDSVAFDVHHDLVGAKVRIYRIDAQGYVEVG